MFSGSHRDKIVQQQKKSVLATLCRELANNTDRATVPYPAQTEPAQQIEQVWQAWLAAEEQVRLVSCILGEICFPCALQWSMTKH
jgi:hypothetical protein